MPLDAQQKKDLESAIALGRKKELPFGVCLGKKPDATVWKSMKTKSPEVNGKLAKKEGETGLFTFGVMTVKSKDINLVVHGKMVTGLVKKLKLFLKEAGLKMKVRVFDLEGNALEADDEDDELGEAGPEETGAPEPDPQQDKWKAVAVKILDALKKAEATPDIDLKDAKALWAAIVKQANAGAYSKALGAVPKVAEMLKSATEQAKKGVGANPALAKKWQEASGKLAPLVKQMVDGGFGEVQKIGAVWDLAKAKASATPPDFTAALKAVGALAQLLNDAKKAAEAAAEAAVEAQARATPEPAMAGAEAGGPSAPPPDESSAPEAAKNDGAKVEAVEKQVAEIEAMITKYNAIIPGGTEPVPPKWTAALQGVKTLLAQIKADPAKMDKGKLDKAAKALTGMKKIVSDASVQKTAWKSTHELVTLRLAPLDHHPKAADPEIKPVIDAIKADLAKAVAKANGHDHAGAIKDAEALLPRCAAAETMADDFAEWKALDAPRKALAQTYLGKNSSIASITTQMRAMETTYTQASADATAKKYKDAVAKLDLIPGQFEKLNVNFRDEKAYLSKVANHDPRLATVKGKDVDVRKPVQKSIDEFSTKYAAAKALGGAGDFGKAMDIMADLWRILSYIEKEITAIDAWNAALKAFDTELAKLKGHAGASGIQDVILEMERDRAAAMAEAKALKHSTARAVINRSIPKWNPTETMAAACADYLTARKAAQDKVDALQGRAEAATTLEQAKALLDVAGTQALGKNFAAAKTSAEEAGKRADAAKDAADTQDEVNKLHDTGKLDKIEKSWSSAYKVYSNIRKAVAKKDKGNVFATLLTAADGEADKGKTAHKAKDYTQARAHLDKAISDAQQVLVLVLAHGPYEAHKATVFAEIATLTPLNVDNTLQAQIDAAKALLVAADTLVQAPAYDYPAAEKKLVEASKIVVRATADAPMHARIKGGRAIIASIQTAINANNAAKTAMPKRLSMFQKMLTDIDALVVAGKLGEAEQKANAGAAMRPANLVDITTVQACIQNKKNWHDNWLPKITGPAAAAGAKAYQKVQAKLAIHTGYMTDEIFDAALNALNEVSWAVVACDKVIKAAAAYAPVKAAADAKLTPLRANAAAAIAPALQKIVADYDKAVAEAAKDNYAVAQKLMATIPAACDKLTALNTAAKAYEPKAKAALDKLTELKAHAQADAVAAMIERLQGKYDNALKYAADGDYATAQKMMEEIVPAGDDAIATADRHGLLEAANAVIGGDDDSAPWWPQIQAAKASITIVSKRDHAEVAQARIDEAFAKIAEAEKDGQEDSVAKAALKAGLEACNIADEIISQYQFHAEEIDAARTKVAALGSHARKAYIAPDMAELDSALDAASAKARTGTDVSGVSADIEAIMKKYHDTVALADAYGRYLALRADPEVEPRLAVLEAHEHRYAIKPSIDTMRAKLDQAAKEVEARNVEAAIKLLEEARALGTSAFVTAEMTGNTPPKEEDLKKILSRPGGADELDAIVDKLPEEAQRAVLKVAFKARYGCDIENFNNKNLQIPIPDGSAKGPNIKAFYQAMEDLPPSDTVDNESMQKFSVMDANGGGSFYRGSEKRVVMDEGNEAYSNTRQLGSPTEVNVTDDDCKPANDDPVNYFNWNTLHEVGHAVDDKHGYMDKNGGTDTHGGWVIYGSNVKPIAEKIKTKYDYDLAYITAYLAGNNNPAVPEKPSSETCSDEEWESRRLAVRDYVNTARVGNKPWGSMGIAAKLEIGGMVYQESYDNNWHAYKLSARSQGITAYQFRAPGEWFSEIYAAYHSDKLKPAHPAVKWLATL